MARIVVKNGFIKGGSAKTAAHLDYLVKYIATREGVELIKNGRELWHATRKQQTLVNEILREFPDSQELFEYEDYLVNPNRENASEFITIVLEQNLHTIGDNEKYLDYIANRPRVEKFDSHGLFDGGDEPLVLAHVAEEVSAHTGNVWTPIISLRREDAARLGYDNAHTWKSLLSSKALEFAENLKIQPDHLKWYAAFHNESHHPHIHMICYSTNPKEGYLTRQGIRKMKSSLAQDIFQQELLPLYEEKSQRRDELREQAATTMRTLIREMKNGILQNDRMEQLMTHLSDRLQKTSGKKQYGYLRPEMRNVVDQIVDELVQDSRVSEAYRLWWETRGKIEAVYTEKPSNPPPLSQCPDFKPIRNMVIQEAVNIGSGTMTFEEPASVEAIPQEPEPTDPAPPEANPEDCADAPQPRDNADSEPDEPVQEPSTQRRGHGSDSPRGHGKSPYPDWWTDEYKQAKQNLYGDEGNDIPRDFDEARALFLSEAGNGNPLAMYDLGRMCADGLGCEADTEEAQRWYAEALDGFQAWENQKPWKYTEYRIGKMYDAGLGTEQDYDQAADWLSLSTEQKYKYAQYSLGCLYYHGKGVEKKREFAFDLYTRAADQHFPYASFELGKMLRDGVGCEKNSAESNRRFKEAFLGFTDLEKQSHDDKLQYRLGWMLANGIGTEKDVARAKAYLEQSAGVGNPFACFLLAKLILSEEAPSQEDIEKSLRYLRQAVEADNSYAAYFLGKLYQEGRHVPQSIAEAVRLYKIAAEQDNEYAAYRLGKLYLGGEGVLKDVEAALHWMNLAADKKNQYAEYALGVLCLKGEDVPKDVGKAIEFLKRAAAQGNQFAQYQLGKVYLIGEDVPTNIEAVLRYLNAAAEPGNQYAQYTLGKLYLMGKDVPRERETAARWFKMSAAQGNVYAQFFLDHMDQFKDPSVALSVTRLLHHLSCVFSDLTPPIRPIGLMIDRKRRLKLEQKKRAAGHARGDHETEMTQTMTHY